MVEQESRPCKRRKILKTLSGVKHEMEFFDEGEFALRAASATLEGFPSCKEEFD